MELKSVDAALLQKAVLAAAKGLEAKKEWINELNVFPVPDGDTGTNQYDHDDHGGCERSGCDREPDNGVHREGSLIRFLKRRPR